MLPARGSTAVLFAEIRAPGRVEIVAGMRPPPAGGPAPASRKDPYPSSTSATPVLSPLPPGGHDGPGLDGPEAEALPGDPVLEIPRLRQTAVCRCLAAKKDAPVGGQVHYATGG